MNAWSLVLAIHLLGAMGIFAAVGVEVAVLAALWRARTGGEARRALSGFGINTRLGPPSLIAVLGSGFAMLGHTWAGSMPAWIGGSLLGMVVVVVLGAAITGRAVGGLERELRDDEAVVPRELAARGNAPALRVSLLARIGILVGIVLTMLHHFDALPALAAIGGGALSGAAFGWLWAMRGSPRPV